jgi:hypothetical protein
MQSTLTAKSTDDPCDDVVIVPDAVRVAPSDEELSNLLQQAARQRVANQARTAPDLASSPPIDATPGPIATDDVRISDDHSSRASAPLIDSMSRPVPANDERGSRVRRSLVRQATRAFVALLLAVGIGLTAVAWKSYGAAATKLVATLATQFALGSSRSEQSPAAQPAPPAVRAEAANASVPAAPASPDSTELLQSMARDLAALEQQVEELKAGMEQLKASQQQMSRDVAKAAEANPRPRSSSAQSSAPAPAAPPPRPAALQSRKPMHLPSPPQGVAASSGLPPPAPYYAPPQGTAASPPRVVSPYYVPPQPALPPQATAEPPIEADSSVMPRPPMPVR